MRKNFGFVLILFTFASIKSEELKLSSENDLDKIGIKEKVLLENVRSGPCNIPIESSPISQEEFMRKYAFYSPVVFRRSDKERNSIFKEKCDIQNLRKEFGDKKVTVSSANTYSYSRYSMKLSDYLDKYVSSNLGDEYDLQKLKYGNETWYFFGENNFTEWKSLLDLYERPKYTLPDHDYAYSFGVAAAFTGFYKNH